MQTIISALSTGFAAFFSFKAYVILPVFMLVLAVIARMKIRDAILAAIKIGVGFAGVFVIFTFFVTQITPAIRAIISLRGLDYPVADVGWPPLAAITWSSSLTPHDQDTVYRSVELLAFRPDGRTDLECHAEHFSRSRIERPHRNLHHQNGGMVCTIRQARNGPGRHSDKPPVGDGTASVLKKLDWNPGRNKKDGKETNLLQEPMVIGILVGAALSLLAGYGVKQTLETSINIGAVMFLLPRCGGLIGEGMGSVSLAFKELMERKFSSMRGLSIAMDTGILMTNPSVIATGLILIPVSLAVAFILPGNRVIPLGDLPNLISIMSLTVLIMKGNVIRSVLAGIPVVATFLLFSSKMAPLYTSQALAVGMDLGTGTGEITAFTDGGNQMRFWFYWLFQGNLAAIAVIPVVLGMMWFAWRKHRLISSGSTRF